MLYNTRKKKKKKEPVDFNAVGSVPLARIVCEIFRIYARSSRLAIAVMCNYYVVYIMRLEPYEYHYI